MNFIYIIIENANRELNSRLLLILELFKKFNKKKLKIIIGEKNEFRNKILNYPKGLIIEKGVSKGSILRVKKWKAVGHKIFMFDEESITYRNDKQYFSAKFDKGLEKYVDCFFLTGNRQKKTILRKRKKARYLLTGNLRFELLKPGYEKLYKDAVQKIKKKYGKFILITSRFANVNYNDKKKVHFPKSYGSYLKDSKTIYKEFKKLPEEIRKKKIHTNIIVRPHPSENPDDWIKITKNLPNCKVVYDDDINPWLSSAKFIIFNRCTTGIEGYLLRKKTFSLDPIVEKDPLKKLYSSISKNYKSAEALSNAIYKDEIFSNQKISSNSVLKNTICNIDKKKSHIIISNYLNNYLKFTNLNKTFNFDLVKPIDLIKFLMGKILSLKKGFRKYSNQKIGNFNYFTLKKTLNNFINLKEYKSLKLMKIKQIGKRIFLIHVN